MRGGGGDGPVGVGIPLIENVSSIILEYRASPDTPRTLPSPYFDGEEGSAIGLRSSSGLRVHLQADWEVKITCFARGGSQSQFGRLKSRDL